MRSVPTWLRLASTATSRAHAAVAAHSVIRHRCRMVKGFAAGCLGAARADGVPACLLTTMRPLRDCAANGFAKRINAKIYQISDFDGCFLFGWPFLRLSLFAIGRVRAFR
jgi:hypothetical protein